MLCSRTRSSGRNFNITWQVDYQGHGAKSIHQDSCNKLQDSSTRPAVAGSWREAGFLLLYWSCGSGRNFVYSMQANRKPKPRKKWWFQNVCKLKGLQQIVQKQNAFFYIRAIDNHLRPKDQAGSKTAGGSTKKQQLLQERTPNISLRQRLSTHRINPEQSFSLRSVSAK